ncbi:MAG: hypothetical protein K2X43_13255 [Hyphomonadaceae bacterium]|jgi:hypothetical protein|nr:hypothetical protein [Hyphomonadaceae bacterium]
MLRLRCGHGRVWCAASVVSLYALVLAGCATTAGLTRTGPVVVSSAETPMVHAVQLTNEDAERVVAHAIAEHEMRRP